MSIGGRPLLEQLVTLLETSAPERLSAIEAAVAAGALPTVLQQAHALRSGAGNLGATGLTAVATALETQARAGIREGLPEMTAALRQHYETTRRELHQVLRELAAAPGVPTTPAPAPPAGRPVVVLVEDNADNLVLTRTILQARCAVEAYNDGPSALAAIRARPPALVVLDISLPGMDGEEVLRQLRADPHTRTLPVLALTAHAMKGDRERFLAAGFDAYLAKPIAEDALLETVARLLAPAP